jgi:hypothetical protein
MTDLQINIALAKAMGWVEFEWEEWMDLAGNGFITNYGQVLCIYKNSAITYKFDYRDPVIFVAICKHWNLDANFHKSRVDGFAEEGVFSRIAYRHEAYIDSIEKAAALVAIEYAKRKKIIEGVKL